MKPVYFVAANNNRTGSCKTRGIEISNELRKFNIISDYRNYQDMMDVKDSIIIYIKCFWGSEFIERLKNQNNIIIADTCCGEVHPLENKYFELCDGIIYPNKYALGYYARSNIKGTVIYHHIDPLYNKNMTNDSTFKLCYIGSSDTLTYNIPNICSDISSIFDYSRNYNCHYCVWKKDDIDFSFRPNSKLSTAAGCEANIILSKSPTHLDLLDASYPYYTDSNTVDIEKVILLAKETFNKNEWKHGKNMIMKLKKSLSLTKIVDDYIQYLEGF